LGRKLEEGLKSLGSFRLIEPDPLMDQLPPIAQGHDEVVVDDAGGLMEVQKILR